MTSSLVAFTIVDATNIAPAIASGFTLFRERAARFAALVFPESFRPNPQLTPLITSELERAGAIEVLVLVQNSTAIGFVASSIGLRSPRVKIVTARRVEDIDTAGLRKDPENAPLTSFEASPSMAVEDSIRVAFDVFRSRGARNAALVFPRAIRLGSSMTAMLSTELDRSPTVRMFFLVHDGSSAGFVAAAVGLRVPHVRVRAMTTLAGVERLLQFTGGKEED